MNPRIVYIGGFVVVAGYISYNEVKYCHEMPWPPRIVATGLVFAFLELFSGFAPELAAVIAIGFALGMIVNNKILVNKGLCDQERKACGCGSQVADAQIIPGAPLVAT